MSGLVKSSLQTVVVDGIYNDILTKNAQYYYFLGKTSKWTVADGATPGEDGIISGNIISAPPPQPTFQYELETRNNIIVYKQVKSSDVSYVITKRNWTSNTIYDMYDDSYSPLTPAHSGATRLEAWTDDAGVKHPGATFFVLTSLNNVYKCISNNYDSPSVIEPANTGPDEFTTADGYIWQFMYNIPIALQNKFYTADFMPVMTALRNQFYENGAIGTVAVLQPGSGYSNNTSLTVLGDGFLEDNPYSVDEINTIVSGGAGYKSSTSVSGATWLASVATFTSTSHGFSNGDNITIRGVVPTNYNGNYVVANAAANTFDVTLVANPGTYTSGGTISKKIMTFSVPLWGAHPTQSTGYVTITGGVVTLSKCDQRIVTALTVFGYGYDQTGSITIDPPIVADYDWSADTTYQVNKIIRANNNFYTVVPIVLATQSLTWAANVATVTTTTTHNLVTGFSVIIAGVTAPTGSYNGTFTITITGSTTFTYSLIISDPGTATVQGTVTTTAGQTNATLPVHNTGTIQFGSCALQFTAATAVINMTLAKTEAKLTPIVIGGQITGVTIDNGGVGYTYCNVIPVDSPSNSSAILGIDLSIGSIDTKQADVELAAFNIRHGAISYIKMEFDPNVGYKTGYGYNKETTSIVITGDGTGATAIPEIVNGSIVAINLTNHGTGYTKNAAVTILPPHIINGVDVGAKARAIISPPGGHGSNAIKEFYSSTILFYSVLSDERLHKLQNLNDYRQFGVIKNPLRYNSSSRIAFTSATACWLITATSNINILNFLRDDELDQGAADVYRIIEISGDKMIIQSTTRAVPIASSFTNRTSPRNGNTFLVQSVTSPEVDKFSGDILFIDNKIPFVVTVDQMVAFRTTIGFL